MCDAARRRGARRLRLEQRAARDRTAATTTTGATTTTSPAKPVTVSIVVQNGAPKGGIVRTTVNKDDHVVLVVKSDVADEIHLHGYDKKTDVTAGGTARLPFVANDPGPLRGGARVARRPDRGPDRPMIFLAHGIGGVRDLPVPESFFFTTAAIVLVVSFVLLGLLWKRPLLEAHADGRRLPARLSAILLSGALRVALQAVSVALFVLTLATAAFGTTVELLNFAPTFVYVVFWLGVPLAVGAVRERVAGAEPVARARGLDGVAPRGVGAPGAARSRVDGSVGALPGGRCALLVRGAGAREPAPRVPADARDRHRAVLVLGARGDGGVRTRGVDAVGGGVRRRVRAPLPDLGIRRARGPCRPALALHRACGRGAASRARSSSSR